MIEITSLDMIVPAAGIGKRMKSVVPKQYLKIFDRTVLEHTVNTLLSSHYCNRVIVAVRDDDPYFGKLGICQNPRVKVVTGGAERVDSVLSGLREAKTEWVLVHDAARPCLTQTDLNVLIEKSLQVDGGILGCAVRDTMKRTDERNGIIHTVERKLMFRVKHKFSVERKLMFHALTPQMFRREQLIKAVIKALEDGVSVTDESSAMEYSGYKPLLVEGRADNIKITQPADLKMAEFIISSMVEG